MNRQSASTQISPQSYTHLADHVRAFTAAVFDRMGASLSDIAPGELVRFDEPDKRRGNRACWAVLHLDGCPAGAFGNWRTGESHTWHADHNLPSQADRERTRKIIEADKRRRELEREAAYTAAVQCARDMWRSAAPATINHRYIAAKRVPALCLRVLCSELLVPLRTVEGELVNLQRIRPDGGKLFLKGGRVKGCFCLLGTELPERGELYLCEGIATALTVRADTRLVVAAAMNAGNLRPVAEAIRAARPSLAIVIAADNDHRTEGNPGIRFANEAARAVGGAVTWPSVCGATDCTCTDFNDVQQCSRAPV